MWRGRGALSTGRTNGTIPVAPSMSEVTDPAHQHLSKPHLPINLGPSESLFSNCSL